MRSFAIAMILLVLIGISFVAGVISTQTVPMLISFCAMPFVLIALGWTARGLMSGRRLALVEVDQRRATQKPRRQVVASPQTAEPL